LAQTVLELVYSNKGAANFSQTSTCHISKIYYSRRYNNLSHTHTNNAKHRTHGNEQTSFFRCSFHSFDFKSAAYPFTAGSCVEGPAAVGSGMSPLLSKDYGGRLTDGGYTAKINQTHFILKAANDSFFKGFYCD
jgi:hypothetical protein